MSSKHPKAVRRRIIQILYERYLKDPLDMLTPEDVLEDETVLREDLMSNIHYLSDRGLVELMIGYNPPTFAAARITADGIDLVENRFEFDLRFPPSPGEDSNGLANVPTLMERLVEEADFSPLDGDMRRCLLRDIQYLREELSRPETRWRKNVIATIVQWIEGYFEEPSSILPTLEPLKDAIRDERR